MVAAIFWIVRSRFGNLPQVHTLCAFLGGSHIWRPHRYDDEHWNEDPFCARQCRAGPAGAQRRRRSNVSETRSVQGALTELNCHLKCCRLCTDTFEGKFWRSWLKMLSEVASCVILFIFWPGCFCFTTLTHPVSLVPRLFYNTAHSPPKMDTRHVFDYFESILSKSMFKW